MKKKIFLVLLLILTMFSVKIIHYNFKENSVEEGTLLAVTDSTFKITYHGNSGLSTDGTDEIIAGGDITDDTQNKIGDCSFTKEGYSFVSWNTKADGSGTTYNAGDKIISLDLELYAIWTKNEGTTPQKPTNPTKPTESEKTEESKNDPASINEIDNLPTRKDIDEVEDNPKTGNKNILIVSGGIVSLAAICYSTLNKKDYFKKI